MDECGLNKLEVFFHVNAELNLILRCFYLYVCEAIFWDSMPERSSYFISAVAGTVRRKNTSDDVEQGLAFPFLKWERYPIFVEQRRDMVHKIHCE